MSIIKPEFVDRIISSGPLADARRRVQGGSARPRNQAQWDKFSSWSLICEEILDTEHAPELYDDIVAELNRRGFSFEQIDAMRRFAWETVGWLNYDKMLWEWIGLDEKDIRKALDWQLRERIITRGQHADGLSFIENPRRAQRSPEDT
jgi:hypothetical protein